MTTYFEIALALAIRRPAKAIACASLDKLMPSAFLAQAEWAFTWIGLTIIIFEPASSYYDDFYIKYLIGHAEMARAHISIAKMPRRWWASVARWR